ncbi:MAG: hypothetical protein J6N46_04645, partial [Bacteroidales bacterium]|nr:hypothetical protein [Bacteroidales bacterium]
MSAKRFILSLLGVAAMLCACSEKEVSVSGTPIAQWGKSKYYEDFLWKKWKPDTLKQTLVFEFNDDAVNFMQKPLQLALYKKSESGKMIRVKDNEMRVFVDGKPANNNVISIIPKKGDDETVVNVGIVFDPTADNKIHHWYFKPTDAAGLERINDLNPEEFGDEASSLMDIQVEKAKVANPLATGTTILGFILLAALVLWLAVLQYIFFPRFKVRSILLTDPAPYMARKTILRARQVVLTSKRQSQGIIGQVFTGKIIYEVNDIWTSDIIIVPRDRQSVRVSSSKGYLIDGRRLMRNQEYTIQNESTKT